MAHEVRSMSNLILLQPEYINMVFIQSSRFKLKLEATCCIHASLNLLVAK